MHITGFVIVRHLWNSYELKNCASAGCSLRSHLGACLPLAVLVWNLEVWHAIHCVMRLSILLTLASHFRPKITIAVVLKQNATEWQQIHSPWLWKLLSQVNKFNNHMTQWPMVPGIVAGCSFTSKIGIEIKASLMDVVTLATLFNPWWDAELQTSQLR